jgi:hypothetical protein
MDLWRPETSEELDRRSEGRRVEALVEIGQRVLSPVGLAVVAGLNETQASLKVDGLPGVAWWARRSLQSVRPLGELPGTPDPVEPEAIEPSAAERETFADCAPAPEPEPEPEAAEKEPEKADAENLAGALSGDAPDLDRLVSLYGETAWVEEEFTAGKRLRLRCCICGEPIKKGDKHRAATHKGRGLRAHTACFEKLAAACRAAVAEVGDAS